MNKKPCKKYETLEDVFLDINNFQKDVLDVFLLELKKYSGVKIRFMMNKIMINFKNSWFYLNFKYPEKIILGIGKISDQKFADGMRLMSNEITPAGMIKIDIKFLDENIKNFIPKFFEACAK